MLLQMAMTNVVVCNLTLLTIVVICGLALVRAMLAVSTVVRWNSSRVVTLFCFVGFVVGFATCVAFCVFALDFV